MADGLESGATPGRGGNCRGSPNFGVREEYSANVIGPIKLFSELIRLEVADIPAYERARSLAWNWMMKYPMQNDAWSGYFEDVYQFDRPVNYNQYSAMETARYLMQHPEEDPAWPEHVAHLIDWVERTLIFVQVKNEPGVQWGGNVVSEQVADMNKMGSHTARYAAINALWFELTGNKLAKQKAFHSFNWASYMSREWLGQCRASGSIVVVQRRIWRLHPALPIGDGVGAGMSARRGNAPAEVHHCD